MASHSRPRGGQRAGRRVTARDGSEITRNAEGRRRLAEALADRSRNADCSFWGS